MLIEATTLEDVPVEGTSGQRLGNLAGCIFNGSTLSLAGFSVKSPGLLKKLGGLPYEEVLLLSKNKASVDDKVSLLKEVKSLSELFKHYGPVLNVPAKTESGKRIGKVMDVFIEAESGLIIRFYLRNLLREQIIPRQFVVSLSPEQIVFKDIVDQPIFNQVATAEANL